MKIFITRFGCLLLLCVVGNLVKTDSRLSPLSSLLAEEMFLSCEVIFTFLNNGSSYYQNQHSFSYKTSTELSSGAYILAPAFNGTVSSNLARLKDIHRFSRICGVAVVFIEGTSPGTSSWLFNTLTPSYLPIIRKDQDHFIFVFNNADEAHTLLLSEDFGNKVKFKIGLITAPNEDRILLKKVDLFAPNGGIEIKTIETITDLQSGFLDTKNFNGKLLRVVNPKGPSYFQMTLDPKTKTYRKDRGLYKVWLDYMMNKFNFSITLTLSSASGSTGKQLKNGTWVGSVGDIYSGRADLAAFCGHIYQRHTIVDWSAPISYEWTVFITQKPKPFFSPSAIYRPFPVELWIGCLASVFLIGVVIKTISKYVHFTPIHFNLPGLAMCILASFLEQDSQMYLDILGFNSVRVLFAFWLLFSLVISTAYRGKLVSLIAFPALSWVPTSFDQLAYSNYRVALNVLGKGGATYAVLSTSKSPVYETFFKRIELFPDPVKCMKAAFNHDLGCLMVKSVADYNGAKNFTDRFGRSPFQASEQTALFREDGYIWEKRAVIRTHIDKLTWAMMDSGILGVWLKKDLEEVKKTRFEWERKNPEKQSRIIIPETENGPSKLQVAHLIGLVALYSFGVGIGTFCLCVECITFHKKKEKTKK